MGNRRMGLGRMEKLLEAVDRDLDLANSTLTNCTITTNQACTFSGFLATANDKGFSAGPAAISGLTPVVMTTATVASTSFVTAGKYVQVSTDAQTITLPSVVVGASIIIVCTAADAGALLTISPQAGDKFLCDFGNADGTDDKDIILAKVTQKQYDYVHLVGMSGDGWAIVDKRGTWTDQA